MDTNTAPTKTDNTPPADPGKSDILRSILGLVEPSADAASAPAAPAEPAKEEPTKEVPPAKEPPPAEVKKPRKVEFKVRTPEKEPTPQPDIDAKVAEAVKKAMPAPTPPPVEDPISDLTEDEREELELAEYAAKKDPAKKGLREKFIKFYAAQRDEIAKRRAADPDFDPSTDESYGKWLKQAEPQLPTPERRRLFREMTIEAAKEKATAELEQRLNPKLTELDRKTRLLAETPAIEARAGQFLSEVASVMPEDMVKFFEANGKDVDKLRDAYPDEYPIVEQVVNGATTLAREYMKIKKGVVDFDERNQNHAFLNSFVDDQAKKLLSTKDPKFLVQNGKSFVHPYQYDPSKAASTWTFSDEDVLSLIRYAAEREAKAKVSAEKERAIRREKAKSLRSPAQPSAPTATETPASPRTPTPPSAGAAAGSGSQSASVLSKILGL